jgi:hypothetical protein
MVKNFEVCSFAVNGWPALPAAVVVMLSFGTVSANHTKPPALAPLPVSL